MDIAPPLLLFSDREDGVSPSSVFDRIKTSLTLEDEFGEALKEHGVVSSNTGEPGLVALISPFAFTSTPLSTPAPAPRIDGIHKLRGRLRREEPIELMQSWKEEQFQFIAKSIIPDPLDGVESELTPLGAISTDIDYEKLVKLAGDNIKEDTTLALKIWETIGRLVDYENESSFRACHDACKIAIDFYRDNLPVLYSQVYHSLKKNSALEKYRSVSSGPLKSIFRTSLDNHLESIYSKEGV